jgi:polyvinyl alcohol dehydrogenase (cytochrome)
MKKFQVRIDAAVMGGLLLVAQSGIAQQSPSSAPDGAALFTARCKGCHDPAVERAPSLRELALRSRPDIVSALSGGVMAPMAKGLSRPEIESIAAYLTPTQQLGYTGIEKKCEVDGPIRSTDADWPTLGLDSNSSRFQAHPGLTRAQVPRLKLKWAFSMPGGGQPIVVGDWLFVTNRGGRFYALDAKSGCVHWSIADAASRNTPMVVRSKISPSGWATFIGVSQRVVRAFDAQNGKEIWHSEPLETHNASGISGTPVLSGNQLFVPLSSGEEGAAMQASYVCCTFRGSLAALDATTGAKQWQTFMITEPLQPTHLNAKGVQMQGPAGAPIWASPTVDAKRGVVYVVTGDSYTDVNTDGDDAIVALDMKSGAVKWRNQVTTRDNYIMGCTGKEPGANCPRQLGPDFDFGATPILIKSLFKEVLIAGQKSGWVYGIDTKDGHTLWRTSVGEGSALGGVEWGIAADRSQVYVPISDIGQLFATVARAQGRAPPTDDQAAGRPGLSALDPKTGKIIWNVPAPEAPCHYSGDRSRDYAQGACIRAQSAAPSVMPGVVFSGTLDGWFRAYDSRDGKIIWAYSTTAQTYATLNGFPAQPGGGIDGMGPTIAGGMVYTMSGFNGASRTGGNGMNVLLAFSVDAK